MTGSRLCSHEITIQVRIFHICSPICLIGEHHRLLHKRAVALVEEVAHSVIIVCGVIGGDVELSLATR